MPDLITAIIRRWRLLAFLTLLGTAMALIASLISPTLYLGRVTALPANSALSDKARLFNSNIEALYPELGSVEELDRIEGTAQLDTLYLALAKTFGLAAHYGLAATDERTLEKAAQRFRGAAEVRRSGYGELTIKVWDKDSKMAAALANGILQTLNAIHEGLRTENNKAVLQKLKEAYDKKLQAQAAFSKWLVQSRPRSDVDSFPATRPNVSADWIGQATSFQEELVQYRRLINEYELALQTTPKSLLVVEQARPQLKPDRPKILRNGVLAFLASLLFSVLLAVYLQSRKPA